MSSKYQKNTDDISEYVDSKKELQRPDELKRYQNRLEYRDVPQNRLMQEKFKEKDTPHRILAAPYVAGFEKSGLMTNQDVKKYLANDFPEDHINNITMSEVRYEDRFHQTKDGVREGYWEIRQMLPNSSIYDRDIVINRQSKEGNFDGEEMRGTIAHEVGHQVHDLYPNPRENAGLKENWKEISAKRSREQCVSDYAQFNESEDFAETYRAFVRDPQLLKSMSSEKYDFMKEKVFKGKEYNQIKSKNIHETD